MKKEEQMKKQLPSIQLTLNRKVDTLQKLPCKHISQKKKQIHKRAASNNQIIRKSYIISSTNQKNEKNINSLKQRTKKKTIFSNNQELAKSQSLAKQKSVDVCCQTEQAQANKSINGNMSVLITLRKQNEDQLKDYEKQFLMKWKAKQFILRLKKKKQQDFNKLSLIKMQQKQRNQEKLREIELKRSLEKEQQLKRKKIQANRKIEEAVWKKQRREEEKKIRLQKINEKQQSIEQLQVSHQSDSNRKQLEAILNRRKSRLINKKSKIQSLDIVNDSFTDMTKKTIEKNNGLKSNKKKQKINKQTIQNQQDEQQIQKHLYLSFQDEQFIENLNNKLLRLKQLKQYPSTTKKTKRQRYG